jgi:hypothetical protein
MKATGGRGLRAWCVAILPILGVIGCSEGFGATPPDQTQIVTDTLQLSSQFDAHQLLTNGNFPNLGDAVPRAFFHTASIRFDAHDTNDNLPPPYDSPNYPDWPSPDSFPNVYQSYAETYHDTLNYSWVLFYVKHLARNRTDSCKGFIAGYSNPTPQSNVVPSARKNRFSFTWPNDVQLQVQTLCENSAQAAENTLIHAVTHEYGHQRAGLTDYKWSQNPPVNAQYHQGPVPTGREDVMAFPETFPEYSAYVDPVFDAYGNELIGDHTTCRGNLLTNQTVH